MEYKNHLPVVPLRDVVVFPRVVLSLYVGRRISLDALNKAMEEGGRVFLATQKSPETDDPEAGDLYEVGCVANVLQMLRLPDGTVKVLVEGISRANAVYAAKPDEVIFADITPLEAENIPNEEESSALRRAFRAQISAYAKVNGKVGDELLAKIKGVEDLERLVDNVAGFFPLNIKRRQEMLEMKDLTARANAALALINKETEVQKIERKIRGRVKNQMEKNHREYYLQEQARAIQRELGDDQNSELAALKQRLQKSGMTKPAREKCGQEMRKLKLMPPMSAEATVTRSYLDAVLSLPWRGRTPLTATFDRARKVLDSDHYGLDKIKERILEYLAVQKRVPNGKAPILCFVGPPGVGKTSLGRSIAAATGRVFGRISLGGVRDEAEIRGHRRTYVGSMPGKIVAAMTRAAVKNPVILLDEIDKMGYDFRGDPSSALLEVLDPEQNAEFSDHYIELPFDLSEVMFVTTANTLDIPPALMDRLELVHLSGYTENERINIARRHLIPRQFKENGIAEGEAQFTDAGVRDIIRYYTREAGVRTLERNISKVCRKVVLESDRAKSRAQAADEKFQPKARRVTPSSLDKYLGARKHRYGVSAVEDKVGQVTGLVWTSAGGDLLSIESCKFSGTGKIRRTGKLGQVLQESVDAAFSAVRSRCDNFQIDPSIWRKSDFHIHLPEGAIPKDGPSAGVAIATAILSTVSGIAVRADAAMTGEITLRGEVLPVGGIKEKLLAAARGGVKRVFLPAENEKDLTEIAPDIKNKFEICLVKTADEVFKQALVKMPAAKNAARKRAEVPKIRKPQTRPPLITH
ncbi:MAG: endopeptidase La [Gammaproteobacteria bacterium]